MTPRPTINLGNYVSYFFSKYNIWFRELGYPLLDVNELSDGEWGIIQCYTLPIIPCVTQWNWVLTGVRNREITYPFLQKWTAKLDLQKKELWDVEEAKTIAMEKEKDGLETHKQEMVSKAHKLITRNPELMNRIGKDGAKAFDLSEIRKNIPNYKL